MTGSVGSASPEHLFGVAVRTARQARDWSQEALATKLAEAGISVGGQSGVARIERGERPTRLNEAIGIASFLGIDLAIFSEPEAQKTEAENLSTALTHVMHNLRRVEAEIQVLVGELNRAHQVVGDLDRRLKKRVESRENWVRQRDAIVHGLLEKGDARVRTEIHRLMSHEEWREKVKRYGDR